MNSVQWIVRVQWVRDWMGCLLLQAALCCTNHSSLPFNDQCNSHHIAVHHISDLRAHSTHKQITHWNWWMNEHFTSSQECHIFTNQSQTAEAQSQGVNWPHFLMWRSNNTFWPPLLTCIKHDYCRVWVTIMHHQRHSLRPLRTQNWHVCLTIPVSSTTAERSSFWSYWQNGP